MIEISQIELENFDDDEVDDSISNAELYWSSLENGDFIGAIKDESSRVKLEIKKTEAYIDQFKESNGTYREYNDDTARLKTIATNKLYDLKNWLKCLVDYDFVFPGSEYEKGSMCGEIQPYGHGHGHEGCVRLVKYNCKQKGCRMDMRSWASQLSNTGPTRLIQYTTHKRNNQVVKIPKKTKTNHVMYSVPKNEAHKVNTPEAIQEYRRKVIEYCNEAGYTAGLVIFHPFRFKKSDMIPYWSPHFHVLATGYVDVKSYTPDFNSSTKWIYKHISSPSDEDISKVVYYLLSHTAYKIPNDDDKKKPNEQSIVYFGDIGVNRCEVVELSKHSTKATDTITKMFGKIEKEMIEGIHKEHKNKDGVVIHKSTAYKIPIKFKLNRTLTRDYDDVEFSDFLQVDMNQHEDIYKVRDNIQSHIKPQYTKHQIPNTINTIHRDELFDELDMLDEDIADTIKNYPATTNGIWNYRLPKEPPPPKATINGYDLNDIEAVVNAVMTGQEIPDTIKSKEQKATEQNEQSSCAICEELEGDGFIQESIQLEYDYEYDREVKRNGKYVRETTKKSKIVYFVFNHSIKNLCRICTNPLKRIKYNEAITNTGIEYSKALFKDYIDKGGEPVIIINGYDELYEPYEPIDMIYRGYCYIDLETYLIQFKHNIYKEVPEIERHNDRNKKTIKRNIQIQEYIADVKIHDTRKPTKNEIRTKIPFDIIKSFDDELIEQPPHQKPPVKPKKDRLTANKTESIEDWSK